MINKRKCPRCLKTGTLRVILYGEPIGEPDPEKYVVGGCCISPIGIDPELQCIDCDWQGFKKEVMSGTRSEKML